MQMGDRTGHMSDRSEVAGKETCANVGRRTDGS